MFRASNYKRIKARGKTQASVASVAMRELAEPTGW